MDTRISVKETSRAMNAKNVEISEVNVPSYKEKSQRKDLRKRKE